MGWFKLWRFPVLTLILLVLILFFPLKITLSENAAYLNAGNYLSKHGMNGLAEAVYKVGIANTGKDPVILNNLGLLYAKREPAIAREYFLEALRLDPAYEVAMMNLAVLENAQAQYGAAIEQLSILTVQSPGNPIYHFDLGINIVAKFRAEGTGDLLAAQRAFEQVLKLDPMYAHAKENLDVLNRVLGADQLI